MNDPQPTYHLQLFVTGSGVLAKRAIKNIERICEHDLHGQVHVEIIDVLKHPEKAEASKILATPTLIKKLPVPLRRIIGDLTNRGIVLGALGVPSEGEHFDQ